MTENLPEKTIPKKMSKSAEEKVNTLCKTYRFRVKENQVSDTLWQFIHQSTGNQRFVYNYFLSRIDNYFRQQISIKKQYESQNKPLPEGFKTFLSFPELCRELTLLKKTFVDEIIIDDNENTKTVKVPHFLNKSHSQPLQSTLKMLSKAMVEYATDKTKEKGKPKKRKKGLCEESVFYKQLSLNNINRKKGYVILPGCKEKLPVLFHRTFKSREVPKTMSLIKSNGKWFINIQTEYKWSRKDHDKHEYNKNNVTSENTIGYDLGVNKMLVTNHGDVIDYSKKTQDKIKKIAELIIFLQKKLSHKYEVKKARKKKYKDDEIKQAVFMRPSANYLKLQKRIKKLHVKIHHIKKNFLHKVSSVLSKNHTHIVRENLVIPSMTKSARRIKLENNPRYQEKLAQRFLEKPWLKKVYSVRKNNRRLLSKNWGMLNQFIEYKMVWNMGFVHKINPAYTSQTCSVCGHKARENRPSQSLFLCQQCGIKGNADVNAARNILFKAFSQLREVVGNDIPQLKRINSFIKRNAINSFQTEILN